MTDFWQCKWCGGQNDGGFVCSNCGKSRGELVARLPDSKMVVGVK